MRGISMCQICLPVKLHTLQILPSFLDSVTMHKLHIFNHVITHKPRIDSVCTFSASTRLDLCRLPIQLNTAGKGGEVRG